MGVIIYLGINPIAAMGYAADDNLQFKAVKLILKFQILQMASIHGCIDTQTAHNIQVDMWQWIYRK